MTSICRNDQPVDLSLTEKRKKNTNTSSADNTKIEHSGIAIHKQSYCFSIQRKISTVRLFSQPQQAHRRRPPPWQPPQNRQFCPGLSGGLFSGHPSARPGP